MIQSFVYDSLDGLLAQLVVGDNSESTGERGLFYRETAFNRAREMLRVRDDDRERVRFEARLRLALHLSPQNAITYRRSNPTPRWQLIQDHLTTTMGRRPEDVPDLARAVAMVLDNWQSQREQVSTHRAALARRDGPHCRSCHVRFEDLEAQTVIAKDPYKPYYLSPEELLAPEVDHVEAISAMGTNKLSNLQLLCRLCNAGKGDGLGLDVRQEAQHAGTPIDDVPRAHRIRLVYYVMQRDNAVCTQCSSRLNELTIRPIVHGGALVRSNLMTVCVACLG